MRKLLTAGIFGTILGIVGTSAVNASIVSSGFLDEKLTEYALSTALDLKANQSDFTELNTQISDSIDVLKTLWNAGTINALVKDFDPNKVLDGINGAFDLVSGFLKHSMLSLTEGWSSEGIGIRFEKYNDYNPGLEGMFNGWTIYNTYGPGTKVFRGLENISSQINVIEENYHTSFAKLLVNGETKVNIESYNYVGPVYPLWKLSEGIDKIGTLPDGYDSVGAALTAIKGIAEEAKAAALAAIPDPKQEGSSGKFVLTVDIVGDNATYRWEKIDREGETTTTE